MANIALDYDGTFTEDPDLWNIFVIHARTRGHAVYVVTMRFPNEDIDQDLADQVDAVIYTSRNFKQEYVKKIGLEIDIWIDDNPMWITGTVNVINPR